MFRVKVCGITTIDDARLAAAAGADAIGLNFYRESPRFVSPEQAAAIAKATPEGVLKVGVFVNADTPTILRAWETVGFDLVQLHGDETPELVAELGVKGCPPVVRAFRLDRRGLAALRQTIEACRRLGNPPVAVLVDALVPGAYGGTGQPADWSLLAERGPEDDFPPLVLAGGLAPENVAEAIAQVRPHGVDVASGVESSRGHKDAARVRAFVEAARAALDAGR